MALARLSVQSSLSAFKLVRTVHSNILAAFKDSFFIFFHARFAALYFSSELVIHIILQFLFKTLLAAQASDEMMVGRSGPA